VAALAVAWLALAPMAQAADRTFASADDAVAALVQAAKANDHAAILAVLGNASTWVFSGDAPADRAALERFVSDYDAKHTLATSGDRVTLTLGKEDDPFAFPIEAVSAVNGQVDELAVRRIGICRRGDQVQDCGRRRVLVGRRADHERLTGPIEWNVSGVICAERQPEHGGLLLSAL